MQDKIEDGYYLAKAKTKGKLSYMKDRFIVCIGGAEEYFSNCVSITGDELLYSLNDIKIIKKLDLNKL